MNQNFSFLLLKYSYLNLCKLFHNTSYNSACHYDTLELQRNCTSKQIRESFLKLSKQNHPDVNNSPHAHKEFLKIQEAYRVLSKPESRARYDLGLSKPRHEVPYESYNASSRTSSGPRYSTPPFGRNPWDDPYFYHNRDRSKDAYYESKPYYGIKGVNRVSNGTVVFFIITLTGIIFILQMLAISRTVSIQQESMNKRSMETQKLLNEIKERAERNGNKVQLDIYRKQLEEMERLRAEQIARRK